MALFASAAPCSAFNGFNGLRICTRARPRLPSALPRRADHPRPPPLPLRLPLACPRAFSTTQPLGGNWLEPNKDRNRKMRKGRPRVPTGGSVKGTTVAWGDYGLRMIDHDRRISAQQLKLAEDAIKIRLRGERFRLYKRVCCNVGVCSKGNDVRMGKGKGSFDHWATRMAVSQIGFELKGTMHEKVARDAFRIAGNKLPGQWEFVKKGAAPMVGITSLKNTTMEELKRPRRSLTPEQLLEMAPPSTTPASSAPVA